MNIIYEVEKDNLRLISFNPYQSYQLDELKFYIPKEYNELTPFLFVQDSKTIDAIKLSKTKEDGNYSIYSVALTNTVRAENGNVNIKIIGIWKKDFTITASAFESIFLNFDNYNLSQQLSVMDELNYNILSTYKKMEELTQMNIEIYKNIEEGLK